MQRTFLNWELSFYVHCIYRLHNLVWCWVVGTILVWHCSFWLTWLIFAAFTVWLKGTIARSNRNSLVSFVDKWSQTNSMFFLFLPPFVSFRSLFFQIWHKIWWWLAAPCGQPTSLFMAFLKRSFAVIFISKILCSFKDIFNWRMKMTDTILTSSQQEYDIFTCLYKL